jgi:muramoyltetrapeptide carboxypeptidase
MFSKRDDMHPESSMTQAQKRKLARRCNFFCQRALFFIMKQIAPLKAGDTVALAAPARKVSPEEMAPAVERLRSWGLDVKIPDGLYEDENQFAGSDKHRAELMQRLLDDPDVKAIFCCRGGYGSIRIIDLLDFSHFAQHPKWLVGYSDATVFHSHIHATLGIPTLHATMPASGKWDVKSGEMPAVKSLHDALFGKKVAYQWEGNSREGEAEGVVVGGNLSILYSLCGSRSQIDTRGKILLIEDLDEYLYHIDRMMQNLRRCGMLDGLAGLVVGGMTDMHDNAIPFGHTAEQIVMNAVAGYSYPVAFGAPFGHLGDNNLAIHLGIKLHLIASNSKKSCIFAP